MENIHVSKRLYSCTNCQLLLPKNMFSKTQMKKKQKKCLKCLKVSASTSPTPVEQQIENAKSDISSEHTFETVDSNDEDIDNLWLPIKYINFENAVLGQIKSAFHKHVIVVAKTEPTFDVSKPKEDLYFRGDEKT